VPQKTPTLASCSFDKHGLVLMIFNKQHRHTLRIFTETERSLPFQIVIFMLNVPVYQSIAAIAS